MDSFDLQLMILIPAGQIISENFNPLEHLVMTENCGTKKIGLFELLEKYYDSGAMREALQRAQTFS